VAIGESESLGHATADRDAVSDTPSILGLATTRLKHALYQVGGGGLKAHFDKSRNRRSGVSREVIRLPGDGKGREEVVRRRIEQTTHDPFRAQLAATY